MFVIGTAGHVDHGKSTLIQALTGIHPSHLPEEKARGMTIDLGFAWFSLPSGREVSIVDVPGHERFIKNMLAGIAGIDLALLVIAADESVMPQTREHLAIIDLLQIQRGIVAITKCDLVDRDWIDLVTLETKDLLQTTTLRDAPIYPVSANTKEGIPELVAKLDELLEGSQPRQDIGRARLPIDRSFIMSGFGTVVTGTLSDGALKVGQEVELILAQKRAKIRGLQTHRKSVETALPGTRTAVNLSGISHEELTRGDTLTIPGWLRPTQAVDAYIRTLSDILRPLKHNAKVTVHAGTNETLGQIRLLDRDQLLPSEEGWAQIRLVNPIPLVSGDFFIIRSTETTLGGGNVVAPFAKRHRRFSQPTIDRLAILKQGSNDEVLLQSLESNPPIDLKSLASQSNVPLDSALHAIASLIDTLKVIVLSEQPLVASSIVIASSTKVAIEKDVHHILASYHREFPLRQGAPSEELRSRLGFNSVISTLVIQLLHEEGAVVISGPSVRLPAHHVTYTKDQRLLVENYLLLLESNPYSPPTATPPGTDLLSLLIEEGKVVKVSEAVVFSASAYREMVDIVTSHLKEHGVITVAEVRDLLNTSRKYALALMEDLDQRHITRRIEDKRVLR
ncbi:MAG: selenocysteine-specific translation elongation factor [SAR202 cluster bacterium Io17-Chloro-G3]|nr:MAG: selenocysteine-specific translation elongation factor [SAR202 cluster bacterium Io17-Chloro-G3]